MVPPFLSCDSTSNLLYNIEYIVPNVSNNNSYYENFMKTYHSTEKNLSKMSFSCIFLLGHYRVNKILQLSGTH